MKFIGVTGPKETVYQKFDTNVKGVKAVLLIRLNMAQLVYYEEDKDGNPRLVSEEEYQTRKKPSPKPSEGENNG